MADPQNEKRQELKQGDRLFGVVASTKVSIVEFVYPEGGTYGFDFVPLQQANEAGRVLRTERISFGETGSYQDDESEQKWKEVSTVHVSGPSVSEGDSPSVRAAYSKIMDARPLETGYQGTVLYSPTQEQVDNALIEPRE